VEPLLRRMGRSSTSYFALEGSPRFYFLRGTPGVVSYTYRSGVALVAGEPLCPLRGGRGRPGIRRLLPGT